MKVEEAGALFGLGRSAAYAAVERGDFPCAVIKIGRRIVVPTAGVRRALLLDDEAANSPEGVVQLRSLAGGQ